MTKRKGPIQKNKYDVVAVIALIGYALVLCYMNFIRIFDNALWGDEAFTARLSAMSFAEMIEATAMDVHPPLYYIFTICGYRILGEHGWMYHLISLIPYVVLLVFALTVIRKEFGKMSAALFMTLASILENAVYYNVEVRMYSWAALFVLLSFYELLQIIRKDKLQDAILFSVFSLCAAYLHYYALLSVAFFYVFIFVWVIRRKLKTKTLLITYILTIVAYLPWLSVVITTFKRKLDNCFITKTPTVKECLEFIFQSEKQWFAPTMWAIVLVALIVIIGHECGVGVRKGKGTQCRLSDVSVWMLMGMGSIAWTIAVGEIVSAVTRPLLLTRYIYPVAVLAWVVLSICLPKLKMGNVFSTVLLAIILVVCVPSYVNVYKTDMKIDDNCQKTLSFLESHIQDGDVLLTNGVHLDWTILDYYYPSNPNVLVSTEEGYVAEQGKTYWLIWSSDLGKKGKKWLEQSGFSYEELYHAGRIGTNSVHVYRLGVE